MGTIRARKAVEVSMERSQQDEFKPVSFIQIAGVVPEIGSPIYIFGATKARKGVEKSLEGPWQDEFKPTSFIQISGAVQEFREGFSTLELLRLERWLRCRWKGLATIFQTEH